MRSRRFAWEGPAQTAAALRGWVGAPPPAAEVATIAREVRDGGDEAVLRLTARFDTPGVALDSLRVDPADAEAALAVTEPELRAALDVAAANIRQVAEEGIGAEREIGLPAGQKVTSREVPVAAAGIYAPGGRAGYPSSVLMCAIPARVAGVERVALASPPGPDGHVDPLVLAATVCIDEMSSP